MWWFEGMWRWAVDNGSVGALLVAALVTAFSVLIAGTALIWTLVGIKAAGREFARGFRRSWGRDRHP